MENISVTQGLLDLLLQQPPGIDPEKVLKKALEAIAFYKAEYEKQEKAHDPLSVLMGFYDLIDQETKCTTAGINISCKKGCAYCCHLFVATSQKEAAIILAYCLEHDLQIDYEYLKHQATFTEDNFAIQDKSACVFLDENNTCKIYEVRPIACRKYQVASEPELCNTKTHFRNKVVKVSSLNIECIASSFVDEAASLPQALLKNISNG